MPASGARRQSGTRRRWHGNRRRRRPPRRGWGRWPQDHQVDDAAGRILHSGMRPSLGRAEAADGHPDPHDVGQRGAAPAHSRASTQCPASPVAAAASTPARSMTARRSRLRRTGRTLPPIGEPLFIPRSWHGVVHMEAGAASRTLLAAPTLGRHGIAKSGPDALSC